ncbi:uncharacterized protein [Chelonus insularis]|uniref:uncharacterized protein n=1 Tax=Chelonus insularis TaxID=460826 RepID=UPI00158C10C7|nr:uncharacterized protein LOC118073420 [Chelonus insularis]
MSLLSRNLYLLSFTGLWRPITWNGWKAQLYNMYTLIVTLSNLLFVISGLMAISIKNNTLQVIVDNVSIILVVSLIWAKISCAVNSRRLILNAIHRLNNRPYMPQDQEEQMIHDRYDRYAKFRILIITLKQLCYTKMIEAHRNTIQRKLICNWVQNHLELLNFVQYINFIFSQVIFLQYTISSLMLCTVVKVLTSTLVTSVDFVGNIFVVLAVIEQIFVQCYAINQMILEVEILDK